MRRRRDAKLVSVRLITIREIEIECIAREDAFRDRERGASRFVDVAVGAGEVWWVENGVEVGYDGRGYVGVGGLEGSSIGGLAGDVGGCEVQAFVGVVADHDFYGVVELAVAEELAWESRGEGAVYYGSEGVF